MTVGELKKMLSTIKDDKAPIWVSSDEELNTLYTNWELSELKENNGFVIFGYSGSEYEL